MSALLTNLGGHLWVKQLGSIRRGRDLMNIISRALRAGASLHA